jgi:hypothetical protein
LILHAAPEIYERPFEIENPGRGAAGRAPLLDG